MKNKILKYIFRKYEKETKYLHPKLKILPPFFYDIFIFLIVLSVVIAIIK